MVLAMGCDGGGPTQCTEGTTQACACAGAATGVQVCGSDGAFGTCDCDPGPDAGALPDGGPTDAGPSCPDGVVQDGEGCDDGNDTPNDGCSSCTVDDGYVCDGAEPSVCAPVCGDGRVVGDEGCDDMNDTADDGCDGCAVTAGYLCDGEPSVCSIDCDHPSTPLFATLTPPHTSAWSFGGEVGIAAGNMQCASLGADHVCTYEELLTAQARGQLDAVGADTDIWLHRVSLTVMMDGGAITSPPGAGGRCNDWTLPADHIADGEYARLNFVDPTGVAEVIGPHSYYFDQDTAYTANVADGHAGSGPNDGGRCGGVTRAIACCYACE